MEGKLVYVVYSTQNLPDCVIPVVIGVYQSYDEAQLCAKHYHTVHGIVAFFEEFNVI